MVFEDTNIVNLLTVPKRIGVDLWDEGRGKMLVVIAVGWFLSISVRMVYPALLPHLRETYDLNLTAAGLLLTVLWLAYGLGQLPGGILADRIGEGTVLVTSTLLSAGTLTLVVTAGSSPILFTATALFGLGTALYGVTRFTILSNLYPDNVGAATGVTMAAGDIGNAVMPPIASFIAIAVAWQYGLGFAIPFFVLVAVGLWKMVPSQTSGRTSAIDDLSIESMRDIAQRLRHPSIVQGLIILVLGNCVMQAFISFYPTYLVEIKGLTVSLATGIFGFFFALGAIIKPLSGGAYDRIGTRYSLLFIMGVSSISYAFLPLIDGFLMLIVVTIPISSLLGYETIVIASLTENLASDMQGTGLGVLRTVYIMIGALSPVAFGGIAERGFFDEGFFILTIILMMLFLFIYSTMSDNI